MKRGGSTRDRWWLPSWRGAVVLLLLGLVINLGVAVAIARWGVEPVGRGLSEYVPPESRHAFNERYWLRKELRPSSMWPGPVPESWPRTPLEVVRGWPDDRINDLASGVTLERHLNWAPGWSIESISVSVPSETWVYKTHRLGFPFGCLRFDCGTTTRQWSSFPWVLRDEPIGASSLHDGVAFRAGAGQSPFMDPIWTLPLLPVGPGVIVNSVFYAGVLWLAWQLIIRKRSQLRLRRGECVRCRYPIVPGKDVCPECGTPVTVSARTEGLSACDPSAADDTNPASDPRGPSAEAPHQTPAA